MELDLIIPAVIVVIFIIGIMLFLFFIIGPPQEPDFKADISIEASQNKTSYIITVKSVRIEYVDNGTVVEEGKIDSPSFYIFICISRENTTWKKLLTDKTEELGLNYIDSNENEHFDKGDKIIISKTGGSEYTPKKGDKIRLRLGTKSADGESNEIKLP